MRPRARLMRPCARPQPSPAAEATGYRCKAPLGLPPQVAAAQPVRGQRSEVSGKLPAPPSKKRDQASLRLGGLTAGPCIMRSCACVYAQPPPLAAEATGYRCKAPLGLAPQWARGQRAEVSGQRSVSSGKQPAPPSKTASRRVCDSAGCPPASCARVYARPPSPAAEATGYRCKAPLGLAGLPGSRSAGQ